MMPVLIYAQNILLAIYALVFFVGIFYLWLQFIGYIRTNAARRMREAEENEESMNRNEAQEEALSDGKTSEEILLAEMPIIEEAARRWLADDKHLRSGITIKTVADEMGIHRYQLSTWLKTTKQMNFSQWITYHRIEAAKHFLTEHPDWSNETVAQACGFSTRNYFQTVFKKFTGLSPAEYVEGVRG
jgi:YesN/AraC family two-component response regulator